MKQIFTELLCRIGGGADCVLMTVTGKQGSAPRDTGAQALADETGLLLGTVGGGIMEAEALRHCAEVLKNRRSELRSYSLRSEGVAMPDAVCGGTVEILFSYVSANDPRWKEAAEQVLQCIRDRTPAVLFWDRSELLPQVERTAYAQDTEAIRIPIPLGERAFLFGAGHCAAALTPLLASVGFRVTVFDNRKELLTAERFPQAERLICGDFTELSRDLSLEEGDYAAVMTSGHTYDLEVEKQLLDRKTAYLGVMGSHSKAMVNRETLLALGYLPDALDRIHCPIGLPIHAATPEEIAVSIAAEMIRIRGEQH